MAMVMSRGRYGLGQCVHGLNRDSAHFLADVIRIVVKRRHQVKAVRIEPRVVEDGVAQPPHADYGDVPLGIQPKDLFELGEQMAHTITAALLAEPAEIGQILADLGRRYL